MKYKLLSFYIFIFLPIATGAQALIELEPAGPVFPVVETDIRIEMKEKIAQRWQQLKEEYPKRIQSYQPANLQRLPKVERNRSFNVDMTYTLDRPLRDEKGLEIYPIGYSFNPLDYMSLTIGLVVIDGSDPDQVEWFRKSPYSSNHRMKLLLSGGYAQPLVTDLRRAVFYLDKDIANRFQLAAVPCVVVQRDKHIQVTEFSIEEENQ